MTKQTILPQGSVMMVDDSGEQVDEYFPGAADAPINVVISTEPGIGTWMTLQAEIAEKGFTAVQVAAPDLFGSDLAVPGTDGEVVFFNDLDTADTLIVDQLEARPFHSFLELIQEIAMYRTIHGHELPELKRVVLIYNRLGGETTTDEITLGERYPSARVERRWQSA